GLALLASLSAAAQKPQTLFVGTYTRTPGRAGIFVYRFDPATQEATLLDTMIAVNPSYLAPSADGKFLYAVSEQGKGKGAVGAYRVRKGKLTLINQVSSEGDDPCYVTTDRKGKNVIVGNYSGGTMALFPVAPDGGLAPAEQVFQYTGSGPNKQRQEASHVHSTVLSPDEDYLLVADLGTDSVKSYRFAPGKHRLTETKKSFRLSAGSGPRHIVFHPKKDWVYILQELSGTVTAATFNSGKLAPLQEISLLPAGSSSAPHSADIHVSPDGAFLYASNRAPTNHIAIFRIDEKAGTLTLVGTQPTGGAVPRNFTLDPSGNFLLAANQDSDRITIFKVDKSTGLLTDTGKSIPVPSPVCLKWGQQ
ncbi:MAG: lactonase family protein, partial [Chitinophagaceae bacterium]